MLFHSLKIWKHHGLVTFANLIHVVVLIARGAVASLPDLRGAQGLRFLNTELLFQTVSQCFFLSMVFENLQAVGVFVLPHFCPLCCSTSMSHRPQIHYVPSWAHVCSSTPSPLLALLTSHPVASPGPWRASYPPCTSPLTRSPGPRAPLSRMGHEGLLFCTRTTPCFLPVCVRFVPLLALVSPFKSRRVILGPMSNSAAIIQSLSEGPQLLTEQNMDILASVGEQHFQ